MQKTRRTIGLTLVAALIAALAVTSFKAFAEPEFNRLIAGSYRVVMSYQGQEMPFLATFTSDGAVTSTFIPLICGSRNDASQPGLFTLAHGSWDVSMIKGRPVLQFTVLSDQWNSPVVLDPKGNVDAQNAYKGQVQINGRAFLRPGPVKGRARLQFPSNFEGGCSNDGIDVDFAAVRIPAVPEIKLPTEEK
jgi:hypothetical protein